MTQEIPYKTYLTESEMPTAWYNLRHAVAVAVLFVCATFIFKFIGNFYMGLQLPAASNIILSAGHTLTLIATVVAWFMG